MEALSQAFEQRDAAFFVDLGGSKRASVSGYKGGRAGAGSGMGGVCGRCRQGGGV